MLESIESPQPRKRRTVVWATTGTLVVAAIVIASWVVFTRDGEGSIKEEKKPGAAKPAAPIPVEVVPVELGEVYAVIDSFATIESEQQAEVFAKADGQVDQIRVEEGDVVKEGALLAELAPEDLGIQLESARLKAENARREFDRAEATYARQMISEQEYEKLKSAAEIAASELKNAQWRLSNMKVLAPFSGKVTERKVVVGKRVKPGDHLFTIASYNPLVARIYLPQRDLLSIKLGQEAVLVPESATTEKWKGDVYRISPIIDARTGTVKVTLRLKPSSGELEQRPGTYVRVQIRTASRSNALMVPKQAVFEESQKKYVFVALNNRAVKREVEVGYSSNGSLEILKGVAAGENVVTMGMTSLKENSELDTVKNPERVAHETR